MSKPSGADRGKFLKKKKKLRKSTEKNQRPVHELYFPSGVCIFIHVSCLQMLQMSRKIISITTVGKKKIKIMETIIAYSPNQFSFGRGNRKQILFVTKSLHW